VDFKFAFLEVKPSMTKEELAKFEKFKEEN